MGFNSVFKGLRTSRLCQHGTVLVSRELRRNNKHVWLPTGFVNSSTETGGMWDHVTWQFHRRFESTGYLP